MVSNHNTVQITTSGGASDGGFLGIFATAPVTAIEGDTYQNSGTGDLYYYDGASWVLIPLASGSADGGHLGIFATAPSGAIAGDQYYNTTDGTTYQFDGTVWNAIPGGGADGGFLGIFATAPVTAIDGDQYYNSTNGTYYYYSGGVWNALPSPSGSITVTDDGAGTGTLNPGGTLDFDSDGTTSIKVTQSGSTVNVLVGTLQRVPSSRCYDSTCGLMTLDFPAFNGLPAVTITSTSPSAGVVEVYDGTTLLFTKTANCTTGCESVVFEPIMATSYAWLYPYVY